MIRHTATAVASAVLVLALAILLLNPFDLWMPDMAHLATLGCLLVAFAVLSVYLLKEDAADEREAIHRMLAGRVAFFVGSLALVIGIVLESMHGTPDMWLVIALVAMIASKIGARIYSDWRL